MEPQFYTREEVYTQEPNKRKIIWFIYYELVSAISNSILIFGLISIWEFSIRKFFF